MKKTTTFFCLLLISNSLGIGFEIEPHEEKCIHEEFKPNSSVYGFVAVQPHNPKSNLNFRISGKEDEIIYQTGQIGKAEDGDAETFSFHSFDHETEYKFCFYDSPSDDFEENKEGEANEESIGLEKKEGEESERKQEKRRISIYYYNGERHRDYEALAKKQHLQPIEIDLMKIEDQIMDLQKEFAFMKDLEAHHRETNEITNQRVNWISLLSTFLLISLAVGQIIYLKRFFKSKQLL
eukprot:TRINITY_DN10433_c0_g1_i1.p1 TRINITY_DN10433_c0_g1~~TRINITY_DN10433_c0_g1_i1.p1  ORF type:complete len:237 (-),score=88.57 TRINITY_DN10433_c0_g1_i1:5-715(-)